MTMEELAAVLGDKIEYEEGVYEAAMFEVNEIASVEDPKFEAAKEAENSDSFPKMRPRTRRENTRWRDAKRAESKLIAYKDILQLVLDDLKLEETPDVSSYMTARPATM